MDKKVGEVRDWQKVINQEAGKCAAKTLRNSWLFLASVLKFAGVEIPNVQLPQVIRNERPWLTPDQIRVFVKAVSETKYAIPALLALHSLRRSEILAITWEKVDLEASSITVRGAIVQGEDQKFVEKTTNKNASSTREVPIMIPELRDALVKGKESGEPVITCTGGTLGRAINRICVEHNLPEVGVHGLRHSFASLAHHIGMPEEECMRIGGWSDWHTMHKIYTHLDEKDLRRHKNKMANFYKSANKNANE